MNKQNQWKENRFERPYDCHNDGMQSMYVAEELTNEECKQFSDYHAKMGEQDEAFIKQKFGEIDQRCGANEEQIQKNKRKLQSIKKNKHKMHREAKLQRKTIKAMAGELSVLQKKQKQLEGKVKLLEKIIICTACMVGCAAPQDTLKDVHQEYKSLYKSRFQKRTKKGVLGVQSFIDIPYKELDQANEDRNY